MTINNYLQYLLTRLASLRPLSVILLGLKWQEQMASTILQKKAKLQHELDELEVVKTTLDRTFVDPKTGGKFSCKQDF